jgi:hypothetical protein
MNYAIPNFTDLTRNQIIEMSVRHVRGNGRPSLDADRSCSYKGIGCAASPFLTEYGREHATGSWMCLADGKVPKHEMHTVQALQDAHDHAAGGYINENPSLFQRVYDAQLLEAFGPGYPGHDIPWSQPCESAS